MLFNSYIFIFAFLPITLLGYYWLKKTRTHALTWLVCASLFFYGWWDPKYLVLLMISIIINYLIGRQLYHSVSHQKIRFLLLLGVVGNLLFIAYYKYSFFIVSNINEWLHVNIVFTNIVLPLGISFFTFQNIAFLVDASRKETENYSFRDYCLFIAFFPQLIAGPIVQHKQMIPQFKAKEDHHSAKYFSIGITLFFIGLFKKIVFADSVAIYANATFNAANEGVQLSFWEAWNGAISYALQLYFDFSGYSDMAIGLGYLFGIRLPINFFSPYQAKNIIEFWRRWHMTLSHFLRDYLYIVLGGNQKGTLRRYLNLWITMLLGGLWHGTIWTFVFWGGLHGFYLTINHLWRKFFYQMPFFAHRTFIHLGHALTFLAVVVAWVPFRAENLHVAKSMLIQMFSLRGFSLPHQLVMKFSLLQKWVMLLGLESKGMFYNGIVNWYEGTILIMGLLGFVMWMPNTAQIMSLAQDKPHTFRNFTSFSWKPNGIWAAMIALLILICTLLLADNSEFLYFQF